MIWDKRGPDTWVRPDGLEIVRMRGDLGQSVFSIRERGEFWIDKRGRRRAWSAIGTAKATAEEERGLAGADDPSWQAAEVPKKAANMPAKRTPRSREEEARAWLKAERKRRGKGSEVTFGEVAEHFDLRTPMEAVDLLWGRS